MSSGALVWGFEAIRELKRVGVMALGSVQNRVCVACCFTRSFSGLRWSSMAVGGFLSCYFISRLLITASYQFNLVNGGGFYFSFESIYSLLPKLFSV